MQIRQFVNEKEFGDTAMKRVVMMRITELYKRKRLDDWGLRVALEHYWERFPSNSVDDAFDPKQKSEAEWIMDKVESRPDLPQKIVGKATGIPAPLNDRPADQQTGPIGNEVEKLASNTADVIFTPILEILESVGIPAKTIKTIVGEIVAKTKQNPPETWEYCPATLHCTAAQWPCTVALHHRTALQHCCNLLLLYLWSFLCGYYYDYYYDYYNYYYYYYYYY